MSKKEPPKMPAEISDLIDGLQRGLKLLSKSDGGFENGMAAASIHVISRLNHTYSTNYDPLKYMSTDHKILAEKLEKRFRDRLEKADQKYAQNFVKKIESGNYSGAYQLFRRHPSLMVDLPQEEVISAYIDFRNKGMNKSASEFRKGIIEYHSEIEETLKMLDTLKGVSFPRLSKDRKEKLFDRVMKDLKEGE